ncbi:MAG: hypothetical protein IK083_01695 [Abditibacteriota bacterium]|nr:hypothetical protein [Abditibacteriota bacterium]
MANKRKDSSINVPLVVILLIIVCGIAFVISYSNREGKRDTGSLPPPNIKPDITPDSDAGSDEPQTVSEPRPAPGPERPAPKEEAKAAKDTKEREKPAEVKSSPSKNKETASPKKSGSSPAPKKMSKEDMLEQLNRFDRKHNENAAASQAAAEPAAPAAEPVAPAAEPQEAPEPAAEQ